MKIIWTYQILPSHSVFTFSNGRKVWLKRIESITMVVGVSGEPKDRVVVGTEERTKGASQLVVWCVYDGGCLETLSKGRDTIIRSLIEDTPSDSVNGVWKQRDGKKRKIKISREFSYQDLCLR